jgi:hypothetical protein
VARIVGAEELIFARSRQRTAFLAVATLGAAFLLMGLAGRLVAGKEPAAGVLAAMLAVVALAAGVRQARRLRWWPRSRLGFFRDQLVLVHRNREVQAPWSELEVVSLANQGEWAAVRWPEIQLTDRLTIRLRRRGRLSFRPASVGLDPSACLDFVLRLRDEPALRERLPVFDSRIRFSAYPVRFGELIHPEL